MLLPAVAIAIIFWFDRELVPSVSAAARSGEHGMFTAKQEDCGGRGPCTWKGDWVSDDGDRSRTNVRLAGDDVRVDDVGERVAALDTGSPASVYADRNIANTLWVIAWVLGAVALLGFCGRIIWRLRREHLLRRPNRDLGSR